MQLRTITPQEMEAFARIAAAHPDRVALEGQLRAHSATLAAPAPIRPASFREVLKGRETGLLSRSEARNYLGLPPLPGTLERLLGWLRLPLRVVVLATSRQLSVARRAG